MDILIEDHKHCGRCGHVLPADFEFFYMGDINLAFVEGNPPYCNACWKEIKARYPGYD